MKSSSFLFASIFALLLISCEATSDKTVIRGNLDNSNYDYVLFSKLESMASKQFKLLDTIFLNKNKQFEYLFQDEPGIYQIKSPDGKQVTLAVNLKEQIELSLTDNGFSVSGSVDTNKIEDYEVFRKESLDRLVLSIRREIKTMMKNGASELEIVAKRAEEVKNYSLHLKELADFAQEQLQKSLALVPTSTRWNTENLSIYEVLTKDFEETYGVITATKELQNRISLLQKTKIGASFPDVNMTDNKGQRILLDPSESTLTLIDFWGSWCPPCRVESPLLNDLYSNYSRTEFDIYGISLDSNRKKWEAALEKDHRVWNNVSALKGLGTPIAKEVGIIALPFNFLLDKEGKIVASNIHGEKLKKFVEEYLNETKSL